MSTIHVEVPLSTEELLRAISRLPLAELDRLTEQILMVRAERRVPHLPQAEAALLAKINEGVPSEVRIRFRSLVAKRQANTLPPDELAELLRLNNQIEIADAERMEHLIALAQLRGVSVQALMGSLGLRPPTAE